MGKGTAKTAQKSVKTAEQTAKTPSKHRNGRRKPPLKHRGRRQKPHRKRLSGEDFGTGQSMPTAVAEINTGGNSLFIPKLC